jgi:hypothetical protein
VPEALVVVRVDGHRPIQNVEHVFDVALRVDLLDADHVGIDHPQHAHEGALAVVPAILVVERIVVGEDRVPVHVVAKQPYMLRITLGQKPRPLRPTGHREHHRQPEAQDRAAPARKRTQREMQRESFSHHRNRSIPNRKKNTASIIAM